MSASNISILKLERTLEEIIPLLKFKYFKPIEELNNLQCDTENKNRIFKWKETNTGGFKIDTINVSGIDFKYIDAIASVEVLTIPKRKREEISARLELDKKILVEEKESHVFFVSYIGSVYAIISGSKDLEGPIRSTLLETKKKSESQWGNVYFKDISQYSFITNFYYWLIDKKADKMSIDSDSICIIDLKGFKSDTERETSSFSGEGENIDKRIPLKSIISIGERLVNLYLYLSFNNIIYSFVLHNDGRITLYLSECGEFGVTNPKSLTFKEAILNIYFLIIPFLNKKFNEIKLQNWDEHEKRIKKVYAIDVILDLMRSNKLDVADLQTAFDAIS